MTVNVRCSSRIFSWQALVTTLIRAGSSQNRAGKQGSAMLAVVSICQHQKFKQGILEIHVHWPMSVAYYGGIFIRSHRLWKTANGSERQSSPCLELARGARLFEALHIGFIERFREPLIFKERPARTFPHVINHGQSP